MNRWIKIIASLPRTIWFNFRYLPLKQAVKLPIWIANNVRIKHLSRNAINLGQTATGICRFGYHEADAVDIYGTHTIIDIAKGGYLNISSDIHIGHGAIISVKERGQLTVGQNFAISGTTSIVCSNEITIGDNVQLSWDTLIMDSDAHHIIAEDGSELVNTGTITIGNKVWIAAGCTLLKGSHIKDHSVVGCKSLLNKAYEGNSLIAGSPAKVIRKITDWNL